MQPLPPSDAAAESLFAAWLERLEAEEEPDFEELVGAHPDEEEGLRSLHRRWRRLHGAFVESRTQADASCGEAPSRIHTSSEAWRRLAESPAADDRYVPRGELARGGMGAVLRVWDARLQRSLAMKVLLEAAGPGGTPRGSRTAQRSRFLDEAQITGQLDHPGIVPVHDMGIDPAGRAYFTMKLVRGRTLTEVFAELAAGGGGWTRERVLALLLRICEAMSYAHAKGVIHRDLKPSNVMVGRFGEVYVMDWGLARVLDQDEPAGEEPALALYTADTPHLTLDGEVLGTPAYMPPEQASGDLSALGPASDVYAVGAMLYHLLAGHPPYVRPGESTSGRVLWQRARAGPPPSLHDVAPGVPPELVALCERAMERDEGRRYPDMASLAADLGAYLEGRVVRAYETGAWAEARKWVRRNRGLAASLAGVLLTLVVGSVAYGVAMELAGRRAEEVWRLSVYQEVTDLLERAAATELWPPYPDRIPELEAWLAEARPLVAERASFEARLAELRDQALAPTAEQRRLELTAHPDHHRLVALRAELDARRLALDQRLGRAPGPAPPTIEPGSRPEDVSVVNSQAWWRVKPGRRVYGHELEGLALASLEVTELESGEGPTPNLLDTLAWAHFSVGQDEAALEASARSAEVATPERSGTFQRRSERLRAAVEEARSPEGLEAERQALEGLAAEVADLERRLGERRVWSFAPDHAGEAWWSERLAELVDGLDELAVLLEQRQAVPGYGWPVARRLAFARELEADFAPGGRWEQRWREALPELRTAYPGLVLEPVVGLVPLGPDPDSGLWEFGHLASGRLPERGPDGLLQLQEDACVVLVLLGGGTSWMGAQLRSPEGHNYDPHVAYPERTEPVHEVCLSPFLVSKFELTRGQWRHLYGDDPSLVAGREAGPRLRFPIEFISWTDAAGWVERAGLELPTEAQWEFAARGGRATPWFTGETPDELVAARVENLWDEVAVARGLRRDLGSDPSPSDGFGYTAPVGSFGPSPFGLHDVYGNVSEYCRDRYSEGFYSRSPWLDPFNPHGGSTTRVLRGGNFVTTWGVARSAYRRDCGLYGMSSTRGVRPAFGLGP